MTDEHEEQHVEKAQELYDICAEICKNCSLEDKDETVDVELNTDIQAFIMIPMTKSTFGVAKCGHAHPTQILSALTSAYRILVEPYVNLVQLQKEDKNPFLV